MKRIQIALALILIITPSTTLASPLTDRVEKRRLQRLQSTEQGTTIRLSRQIVQPKVSARRRQAQTSGIVTRIIDGSVIHVQMPNGDTETVRLLGAEAPILQTGSKKQQCFAEKSKETLAGLLLGEVVHLQKDDNVREDGQGRILRYVYKQTTDVNAWMIDRGFAFADRNNTYARSQRYIDKEYDAQKYDRGLWGPYCEYNQSPSIEFEILQ